MSASIDERIVSMKFDNTQFEAGVKTTLSSLQALEKGMKLDGAAKGLGVAAKGIGELDAAGKRFSLANMSTAVDSVGRGFSAMSAIALGALATIGSQATKYGAQIARGVFDPIKQGLAEYETNLNAIQTILANTGAAGTSLKDVNGALAELNAYSDKTIYNFSEMAKNIGTFTAAGVDLKTATGSIKGIANLAALSGSNSQQASTAMYQLSQAISAGKVSLQDWNSVVNAGMGGTVFQRALAQTAEKMGTLDKGAVKLTGKMKNATINGKSFRESITAKPGEKSWLTSEVLTSTLKQFTGDLTDAQLKAEGFSAAQIKAIQAQAKTAQDAATKVKTFSQLMGTLKESAGSGWANSFQIVLGDFEEAKTMWTDTNNALGALIQNSAKARNKLLQDWKDNGGRTAMIDTVKNAFAALKAIVDPIADAFRLIFPATTGKQLADMTKSLRDFTAGLKIGADTARDLRHIFAGVFAIFGIGWEIIKQVTRVFFELFGAASDGSGSFLKIAAGVGDFLVALHMAIKNGEGLTKFFDGLIRVLKVPIKYLVGIRNAFFDLFSGINFGTVDTLSAKFEPFKALGSSIAKIWGSAAGIFDKVFAVMSTMGQKLGPMFAGVGDALNGMFDGIDMDKVLGMINTGLFAALTLMIKKFVGTTDDAVGLAKGWKDTLTAPFDELTGTLSAMQNTLKAATLLQIAAAVGILALSVVALSKVDAAGLTRALTAITIMFTQLAVAMAVFQKIKIEKGMGQLILMALALRILTSSVKALAELSWEELAKGLAGTAALMVVLAASARLMPDGKKMISSSVGLILMATAIKILASSVKDLADLSWDEMARGLTGVGALLGAITLFTKLTEANKGGIASGLGLILLATGIKILASAMTDFAAFSWDEIGRGLAAMGGGLLLISAALLAIPPSSILSAAAVLVVAASLGMIGDAMAQMGGMEWETIGKGLTTMAGALTLIAAALILVPPSSLLSAAAIFVVAASLGKIADALGTMGGMSWEEIAKGLIVLAGALTIIAVAMAGMTTAIFGAAALAVVTGALLLLLPVLQAFSGMSWAEIAKGLTMLAGVFLVIGVAGLLLTPVIPTLLGLGIAIALLGVGVAAAAVGVLGFAVALTALAAAGAAGVTAIVAIVSGLIGLIPTVMEQIGLGLIAFAQVIAHAGPAITLAITAVLMALLNAIIRLTPKIGQTLLVMLMTLLRILQVAIPAMARAGLNIVTGILNGIASKIGGIVTAGANIIINFLKGLARELPRITDQAAKTIIAFVNGIATAIRNNSAQMDAAGRNLATAIVQGMARGIAGGIGIVVDAAKRLASSALDAAKAKLGIHSPSREFAKLGAFSAKGYALGLDGGRKDIVASADSLRKMINDAMTNAAGDIKTLSAKLDKLKKARNKDNKAIRETAAALAAARVEYAKASKASKVAYSFGDENKKLLALADKQAKIATQLDTANKSLADAIKTRDDYNKQTKDQYDNLPEISNDTQLTDYITDLQKKVVDTQIFTSQLQKLRDLGLNDEMYKQLLAKGTDAIPFVTQILEGGKGSVDEINTLGSALSKAAGGIADTASKALYQAAVDSAAGLVKGLQSQQAAIEKQMDIIAASMVKAIKKALGIKSPSREFMKIGKWSNEGLAAGLKDSGVAMKAAEQVGHNAIDAMRKTLTGLSDIVSDEMDANPTIKPVLDLTEVQKNATKLDRMLALKPLEVAGAYSSARAVSSEYRAMQDARDDAAAQSGRPIQNVSLTQNNYSPKAISPVETYRNTRNQLSTAKEALKPR